MTGEDHTASSVPEFMAREVGEHARRVRGLRVGPVVTATEIRTRLLPFTFDTPMPLGESVRDVADMLQRWTLHATHPGYFGLFVPGTHEAGVWADTLTALYNPQLGAWWHSPAACEIERHTLAFLAGVIGYPNGAAHFTSGASEANLTALLCAIAEAFPDSLAAGLSGAAQRGSVYVSSQAHHSVQKIARVSGLGSEAVRVVPCTATHAMDLAALGAAIAADVEAGWRPTMIIGTAGTTTSGAVDNLRGIAKIAAAYGIWFHVDAAWGAVAGFVPELRTLLDGISEADSVTWDAHKSLSVPMGAGMFFCRHADLLRRIFDVEASYMPREMDEGNDPYLESLQWSRRFIGLKVFLTLATLGQHGIAARFQRQRELSCYLGSRLAGEGWTIRNSTPLPIVCFSHDGVPDADSLNGISRHVAESGRAWISVAELPEGRVLRACVTHDDSTRGDVDILCDALMKALADVQARAAVRPGRRTRPR